MLMPCRRSWEFIPLNSMLSHRIMVSRLSSLANPSSGGLGRNNLTQLTRYAPLKPYVLPHTFLLLMGANDPITKTWIGYITALDHFPHPVMQKESLFKITWISQSTPCYQPKKSGQTHKWEKLGLRNENSDLFFQEAYWLHSINWVSYDDYPILRERVYGSVSDAPETCSLAWPVIIGHSEQPVPWSSSLQLTSPEGVKPQLGSVRHLHVILIHPEFQLAEYVITTGLKLKREQKWHKFIRQINLFRSPQSSLNNGPPGLC